MRTVALYEMLYGVVSMVGGILGYTMASSVESLIAGLISGMLLVLAALQMQKGSRNGLYVTLVVTVMLLGYFGWKFFLSDTGRFIPTGLMAVLSIVSLLLLLLLLVQPAERKRIY